MTLKTSGLEVFEELYPSIDQTQICSHASASLCLEVWISICLRDRKLGDIQRQEYYFMLTFSTFSSRWDIRMTMSLTTHLQICCTLSSMSCNLTASEMRMTRSTST